MGFISQDSLSILPFAPEPISSWTDDTDLIGYLVCLFDMPAVVIDEEGVEQEISYSFWGPFVFEMGKDRFQDIIIEFLGNARKARPTLDIEETLQLIQTGSRSIQIPNFGDDEHFGLMAKYAIAWYGTVDLVLGERVFFSLAHVFESVSELECSIHLASNLYYKQALQVLRSFLEHAVVQLYFCDNEEAFAAWKADQFRVPRFRGRGGMLQNLISRGILSEDLANAASDLYETLNGSIHGAESTLIHRGVFNRRFSHSEIHISFDGKPLESKFSYERFKEWCHYFSRCVDFGIRALSVNIDQWADIRPEQGIRCYICHNSSDFNVEEGEFGGSPYITIECRKCGNFMTMSSDWVINQESD